MHRTTFTTSMVVLLIGVLTPLAAAVPVTIDFGNIVDDDFDPGETYSEDGYTFTVVSGVRWGLSDGVGNAPSGLSVGNSAAITPGDTISVKPTLGGLFTFDAFDFASFFNGLQSDSVNLVGLIGGIPTELFANVGSSSSTFNVAVNPGFAGAIDELRIVGATAGGATLEMDNFVFNSVSATIPEPATATLAMLGLGGLMLRRRRMA